MTVVSTLKAAYGSKSTFYDNLFVIAVSTGLQPGEVLQLTLKDVDFKDSLIRVNKTIRLFYL
jgi:integrase